MSVCKFVRKHGKQWEYGFIQVENHATKNEVRKHVVLGHVPTYEEAISVNVMAMKGAEKIRPHIAPNYWD
jgi:hypothetical protein